MSDCQICLEEMSKADKDYPLLCPTQCGFNMCLNCVDHLVKSSKCGFEEASDGNMHVKVKLQCPQCRGNLSNTIDDTLLVRKVIEIWEESKHVSDSELSGAELRLKYSLPEAEVKAAKDRLKSHAENFASGKKESVSPKNSSVPAGNAVPMTSKGVPVDTSLFAGLESAMSADEQIYVDELMTSGDTNKLAQAAEILSEISEVVRKGYVPSAMKNNTGNTDTNDASNRNAPERRALEMARTNDEVQRQIMQDRIARHRSLNPLPVCMPRFVTLKADFDIYAKHRKVLKFKDDEWDGSVADAFARIHLSEYESDDEDGEEEDYNNAHSGEEGEGFFGGRVKKKGNKLKRNRVLIQAARGKASKRGIRKGDVVSHINGEEFRGNAEELAELIDSFYINMGGNGTFTMVLNAERSTASALRLRAMVDY